MRLKILSYNIHKGFTSFNAKYVLEKIRDSIRETNADLLCLQEVVGDATHPSPTNSQLEYLADQIWPYSAYGKNAVSTRGHHGNAILSKHQILRYENIDISTNRWERRGLLYAEINVASQVKTLHVFCTHLDLLERGRMKQIEKLCEKIKALVPTQSPFILAGDFNDWRESISEILKERLNLEETYQLLHGEHSPSYPSWLPSLRLDRVYHGNLKPKDAHYFTGNNWKKLSDHLPVMAELEWPGEQ